MSGPLDAGRFRQRFELQASVPVPDGMGGSEPDWQRQFDIWAAVRPLAAAADRSAPGETVRVTHEVVVRARAGIAAGMRLVRDARTLAIVAVHDPDGTGRYLVINALETA